MSESKRTADGSQTLERGLKALIILADHPDGLTASEVAARLDVHRSISHRLLTTLTRVGFADRHGSARYRVGAGFFSIADRARPRLRDTAEPVLRKLAAELDATACLVEIAGDAAIATAVAEPPTNGPRFSYRVGNRDPLDRGSGGLAALASGPPVAGEPERVALVRQDRFISTHSEVVPGAYGIAAPIGTRRDTTLAAINVITNREEVVELAIPLVIAAAREISNLPDSDAAG